MQQQPFSPGQIIEIVKRRLLALILPAVVIIPITIAIAFLLPSIYRATATILIEDQEIPQEFVAATVTSYAEKRIETIRQRIMSSIRLIEIIDEYGLYEKEKKKETTEEILQMMRERITVNAISADVASIRNRRGSSTIAFVLSFEGEQPAIVQKVTSKLTSLFLEENLKVRQRQTLETSSFLKEEMNKVGMELQEAENKLARFKEAHINELPEARSVNMQLLGSLEMEINRQREKLQGLREREAYLKSQLAVQPASKEADAQMTRLEQHKKYLIALQAQFTDIHPDVIKTKREIAELEKRLDEQPTEERTVDAQNENPAYRALMDQQEMLRVDIESTSRELKKLEAERARYKKYIEATPMLEQQYNSLLIERKNNMDKYDDLMKKFMESRVAHGLESEQKGERFTLIDPARMPEKPVRPNRLAIILIGIVLGLGAGGGLAAVREATDRSVRNADALAAKSGIPVLASIPLIDTDKDRRRRFAFRLYWAMGTFMTIVLVITAVHFFIMDLDIFWAKLTRNIDKRLIF